MGHSKLPRGFTLIELMIVVAIIGVLSVLAVFGVSRYVRTAKTAEAVNALGAIQRGVDESMTREKMSGAWLKTGKSASINAGFCASEKSRVPKTIPKGKKYVSRESDWSAGKGAGAGGVDIGFYCLRFSLTQPQYYSYAYKATGTGTKNGDKVDIYAYGDLDGNGVTSQFLLEGRVVTKAKVTAMIWAPKPQATNPEE